MNFFPFNSVDNDRVYKAEDFAWYFANMIGNGVFANPTDALQVIADSGFTIKVKPGAGWINGYAFRNDANYALTVTPPDGVNNRTDLVVLRWDLPNRQIILDIKTGSPSEPALTRTSSIWELGLAKIAVSRSASSITQASITDMRANSAYCNFVTGIIDQIDWSDLTTQLDAYIEDFNDYLIEYKDALTLYIQSLHDILDTETASHLLNLINGKVSKTGDTMTGNLSTTGTLTGADVIADDKHLPDSLTVYVGKVSSFSGTTLNVLCPDYNANKLRNFEDGVAFLIDFGAYDSSYTQVAFTHIQFNGDASTSLPFVRYTNDTSAIASPYLWYGVRTIGGVDKLVPINFDYSPILREVVSFAVSDWSSTTYGGYYTATKTLSNKYALYDGTLQAEGGIQVRLTGQTIDTVPQSAIIAAYGLVNHFRIVEPSTVDGAQTLKAYAKTKPSDPFYVTVSGPKLSA